jgi:hypothetical protein
MRNRSRGVSTFGLVIRPHFGTFGHGLGTSGRFVVCKLLLNRIEWPERTCVVKRGCVFSTILWVIIIVVALLAIGFFARGRR